MASFWGISGKRCRIRCVKKLPVQRFYRARQVRGGNHKAYIQLRRALRDHSRFDSIERREYSRRHLRTMADVVAYQANYRMFFFHRYIGEGLDLGANRPE